LSPTRAHFIQNHAKEQDENAQDRNRDEQLDQRKAAHLSVESPMGRNPILGRRASHPGGQLKLFEMLDTTTRECWLATGALCGQVNVSRMMYMLGVVAPEARVG